jgi:hypothetical protein
MANTCLGTVDSMLLRLMMQPERKQGGMQWKSTKPCQQPAQPMLRHCESPSLPTLDDQCVSAAATGEAPGAHAGVCQRGVGHAAAGGAAGPAGHPRRGAARLAAAAAAAEGTHHMFHYPFCTLISP